MRKALRSSLPGVALAVLMTSTALASTFIQLDIPALNRMSEAVVRARVADMRSAWNDDHTMIFTFVTLEVRAAIRGAAESTLVVRVPGGTVAGFTAVMDGAPTFHPGEEVVAFIARWRDGSPMVAGYEQGLSRVETDGSGSPVLRGGLADGLPLANLTRLVNGQR
jgi:hypothetical protein